MYPLSIAIAHAAAGESGQARALLDQLQPDWVGDERWIVARAMLAFHADQPGRADARLQQIHDTLDRGIDPRLAARLENGAADANTIETLHVYEPDAWNSYHESLLLAEQSYFALLWQGRHRGARDYARRVLTALARHGLDSSKWRERVGDAAFLADDLASAEQAYRAAERLPRACYCVHLKLADVYFLLGDEQRERVQREKVYGQFRLLNP